MQELLKLQAEQMKKNTSSLEIGTAANDELAANVGHLSVAVERAANDDKIKQEEKRTKELTEGLKSLADVIKKNIAVAMKNGSGEAEGKGIINAQQRTGENGSKLRKIMFGEQSRDEIKQGSWMGKIGLGKLSPSMAIEGYVSRKEDKAAKEKFIEGAIKNDKRGIALKNLKGEEYARADAGKRYDEIKKKEAEVAKHQAAIDESQAFGYAGKKKDFAARDTAAAELTMMDPRRKKEFVDQGGKPIEQNSSKALEQKTQKSGKPEIHDEGVEETQAMSAKMHAEDVQTEKGMGATLIQSLEVQKQQLQALMKMAEGGGGSGGSGDSGGGSMLETAADLASNVGGKGKSLLGKAGKFLGRHAGKIAAVGGVVMGAMDAYEGWGNANEKEAADNADVDNKLARGEINEKQAAELKKQNADTADISKGSAVGGGVGGAAGAWGGAAAGAAIGSVVPVVGTAIGGLVGGAIGYYGGSKIGEKVGGSLVEGYKGVKNFLGFGGDEKAGEPTAAAVPKTTTQQWTEIAGERVTPGQELSQKQMAVMGMAIQSGNTYSPEIMAQYNKQKNAPTASPTDSSATAVNGNAVVGESKSNADAAATAGGAGKSTNVVNAPSNVTNNYTAPSTPRVPPRNQESSVSGYIASRYAT
jgi:hypothetical protein